MLGSFIPQTADWEQYSNVPRALVWAVAAACQGRSGQEGRGVDGERCGLPLPAPVPRGQGSAQTASCKLTGWWEGEGDEGEGDKGEGEVGR